jgi:hypothetical protein
MNATGETVMKDYLEGLITEREMELSFPETIQLFSFPVSGIEPHYPNQVFETVA